MLGATMTDNRYRPRSPPRTSRYHDPRASTGMFNPSSYDPNYSSQPRSAIEPYQSTRHGSIYDTRPVKSYSYKDDAYPGSTISRTEYAVRPRTNSNVPSGSRRPLSMVAAKNTSPTRRPVISNHTRDEHRPAPYIAREEPSKYLVPASSHSQGREHHQRRYSATKADVERLNVGSRSSGRARGEYHQPGGYSQRAYVNDRASVRDDDYSYTGPKEQFARDMQARAPPARETYPKRERPMSVIEIPESRAPPSSRRDMPPPPPPQRQLERLDRPDDRRLTVRPMYEEPERISNMPSRRHSVRAPVVHQLRDEGYASARDDMDYRSKPRRERIEEEPPLPKVRTREPDRDYERERDFPREPERDRERERDRDLRVRDRDRDRDRERERERERDLDRDRDRDRAHLYEKANHAEDRREVRSREASPERVGIGKGIAAGLGGAAVAGLAGAAIKGSTKTEEASDDDNHKERRHKKHRHRDRTNEVLDPREVDVAERRPGPPEDRVNDDRLQIMSQRDDSASESYEDESQRHRRRRRKHPDRDEVDPVDAGDARPRPIDPSRIERDMIEPDDFERPRRRGGRSISRSREPEVPELERRRISPGEDEDDRPRRVQLVEPERREEIKPKSILKTRLVPFPEDPNPERVGVTPLKDLTKAGVPPGARWTKISRLLVNPEALEKAHERFEERDDYVIVLRVVTKEEIEKFAEKTRELRGKSIERSVSTPTTDNARRRT